MEFFNSAIQVLQTLVIALDLEGLVETLGQNAAAYDDAEATNQATTAMSSAMDDFFSDILGVPTSGSSDAWGGCAQSGA